MGYEHLSITPETEFDEVTESNAKNLLPIPSEYEVALEDKRECTVPISENFPDCDNHSDTFSDSKIDDDISVYDNDFEDIEYVEVLLSDPEIVKPPQDSDIHQLIDECCKEVPEKQKQNMEKTMLDLVKICHHKQFLCIHDDVEDLIKSALDSKLLSINSQQLDKKEQEVKIVEEQQAEHGNHSIQSLQNFIIVHKSSISFRDTSQISLIHTVAPILSTKEPENSLSMGYEHLSITPKTESDEVTESNAENLLPIPSKSEVALEDKKECTVPIFENFPDCDNHSDTFFDSKIDDVISVYDDDFEDIEYVEASLLDPKIVSIEEENGVEEENVVQREEEEDNPSILRPPPELPDDNFDLEPEVISAVMEDIDEPDEHFNP
nr:hypothetical protein [Tanacetum cinerariifolium]